MDTHAKRVALFIFLWFVNGVKSQGCPDGWLSHEGSCYVFINETYNWFDAKVACDTLGAHLVVIETAEENHYLGGLIRSYGATQAWIGLEDLLEEGVFVWVTSRERPEEVHWNPHEPDDRYEGEDCAAMTITGGWFDGHCEDTHRHFICEMEGNGVDIIG